MTRIYNRKTQTIDNVPQYGEKPLVFLYNNPVGRFLLKIVASHFCSEINAIYNRSPLSKKKIRPFIEKHNIDASKYSIEDFKSFSDFFTRKDNTKTIVKAKNELIAPADSKLLCYKIDKNLQVTIKHTTYSLSDLIGGGIAEEFEGGNCLVFRLAMDDYHRYCFVDDGKLLSAKHIKGKLHTVSSISEKYKVFIQNDRIVNFYELDHFGSMIQIEVGALLVGRIKNHNITDFKKGEEKGYFELGGSTIILLTKKDIKIDEDIIAQSKEGTDTKVNYGEKIGGLC